MTWASAPEQGVRHVPVGLRYAYRDLLREVVRMFATKKEPLDVAVTVEIIAFIEAANRSAANHGTGEQVRT